MADAWPPAPPEDEARDAHCERCGSLFHSTDDHPDLGADRGLVDVAAALGDFPPGYDPAEADRLIGRVPHGA